MTERLQPKAGPQRPDRLASDYALCAGQRRPLTHPIWGDGVATITRAHLNGVTVRICCGTTVQDST